MEYGEDDDSEDISGESEEMVESVRDEQEQEEEDRDAGQQDGLVESGQGEYAKRIHRNWLSQSFKIESGSSGLSRTG